MLRWSRPGGCEARCRRGGGIRRGVVPCGSSSCSAWPQSSHSQAAAPHLGPTRRRTLCCRPRHGLRARTPTARPRARAASRVPCSRSARSQRARCCTPMAPSLRLPAGPSAVVPRARSRSTRWSATPARSSVLRSLFQPTLSVAGSFRSQRRRTSCSIAALACPDSANLGGPPVRSSCDGGSPPVFLSQGPTSAGRLRARRGDPGAKRHPRATERALSSRAAPVPES